ncbi:ATP-dependent DNA helicase RecG [Campylobacter mucosalis]|uniref:ATP-dependent DNA helicase RecG n=1 Tax=Campylobacter mucosalis TaxID=202 RepID=UPI0014704ECE|nr:ATP-dependent DNA helicase RecG [Campylobacter mucosalis]
MKFELTDRADLAKIGVISLLDLALFLPKSFEDSTISNEPKNGDVCVAVKVGDSRRANGGLLIAHAFCQTWDVEIKIVIFNAKPWHYGVFKRDKEMILHGNCTFNYGSYQITNPKILTKTGQIKPKFKADLKDEKIATLIAKYVTKDNLLGEGLNENEADFLLNFQKADSRSVDMLNALKSQNTGLETLKFVEIFNYIKKLSGKKTHFLNKTTELFSIDEWLSNLPFTPTNDQKNAINDIRSDLVSREAKRRVVMGDVGSGKTLVILAAALSVYPKKAILMAPTSILAEQIYTEAIRLLPKFMKILLVKSGEKNVNLDEPCFIIGTHVLLFKELPKANIIMIDEQHRFGSNQRAKIDELVKDGEKRTTFVQFSATPIPRTLSLIQSSLVDFSFLKQMPFKKNIKTQILQNSGFNAFLAHLRSEISKGNQAIIVYPLVESSENFNYQSLSEAQNFWLENFKNVYITHGKDRQKEQVLLDFRQNGDLLLATTIVEVGISLPRLSTILVVGAERLGLATLHQLRGRVGRNGGDGYCFLYTKLKNPPERLVEFSNTLDGFKIAQIDLKNRQSGDILDGTAQHGATFNFYEYEENLAGIAKDRLERAKTAL